MNGSLLLGQNPQSWIRTSPSCRPCILLKGAVIAVPAGHPVPVTTRTIPAFVFRSRCPLVLESNGTLRLAKFVAKYSLVDRVVPCNSNQLIWKPHIIQTKLENASGLHNAKKICKLWQGTVILKMWGQVDQVCLGFCFVVIGFGLGHLLWPNYIISVDWGKIKNKTNKFTQLEKFCKVEYHPSSEKNIQEESSDFFLEYLCKSPGEWWRLLVKSCSCFNIWVECQLELKLRLKVLQWGVFKAVASQLLEPNRRQEKKEKQCFLLHHSYN